ncbi:iron-containing alcohol dehydrogenase family protein [Christensenella timonensis]|uniref:iron-containing alcohol dehydrogenase family protein n=1 Tax=Christensenella timonensis TaxID=1816678 RepID=UPI0009EF5F4F|nr:iron-containing alcohol dehydrogenase family protein [Christensenella timonensis]
MRDINTFAVPEGVKIGSGILYPKLKEFLKPTDRVMLIVDKTVDELYGNEVYENLSSYLKDIKREFVHAGSLREALLMAYYIVNRDFDAVIAMGGGKVLDVGKYASTMSKRPFISIPTSMSHDGVASPMAVLKCDHGEVRTLMAEIPAYIIMDMDIIRNAPRQMVVAGLGDLISNITALKDWELAVRAGKAKMDDFAYIISGTAVRAILQYTQPSLEDTAFLTQLAESIVLSGLAMNITGDTRPSSGAEHLISHGIDALGKGTFHGLQAAMASVLVEYLHGGDYELIRSFLKRFGIPASFEDLGLTYEDYVEVMRLAPTTRKNRYTILDEISLDDGHLKQIYDAVYGG